MSEPDRGPGSRAELEQAYRATAYEALGLGTTLDLRVGRAHPELDALLEATGRRSWAFLTAWNPGSQSLSQEENEERQGALTALLAATPGEGDEPALLLPGRGRGLAGDWPPEESVLALGLPVLTALDLARRFGQNALLAGQRGGTARLVWCEDED